MKTGETIWIMSYPKSGTHYLARLLRENFSVTTMFGGHLLPDRPLGSWTKAKNRRTVYITRQMEEATASYASNAVKDISPEKFRKMTWQQLWNEHYFDPERKRAGKYWPAWLPKRYMGTTPESFWRISVEAWTEYAKDDTDFYIVKYEDLKNTEKFHSTMLSLATWLGSRRTEFEDIKEKVDNSPFREGGFVGKSGKLSPVQSTVEEV